MQVFVKSAFVQECHREVVFEEYRYSADVVYHYAGFYLTAHGCGELPESIMAVAHRRRCNKRVIKHLCEGDILFAITFSQLRDEDNQVNVGDAVITSYVSDQYQQGILIGYISTIEDSANNLTKSGTITPVVDFAHLEDVFVITKIKETGTEVSEVPEIPTEDANAQTSETSQP